MKDLFFDNWKAKLASLLIAIMVWYVIKSHLDNSVIGFPVPGTGNGSAVPTETSGPEIIEDIITNPLAPPVPGAKTGGT